MHPGALTPLTQGKQAMHPGALTPLTQGKRAMDPGALTALTLGKWAMHHGALTPLTQVNGPCTLGHSLLPPSVLKFLRGTIPLFWGDTSVRWLFRLSRFLSHSIVRDEEVKRITTNVYRPSSMCFQLMNQITFLCCQLHHSK